MPIWSIYMWFTYQCSYFMEVPIMFRCENQQKDLGICSFSGPGTETVSHELVKQVSTVSWDGFYIDFVRLAKPLISISKGSNTEAQHVNSIDFLIFVSLHEFVSLGNVRFWICRGDVFICTMFDFFSPGQNKLGEKWVLKSPCLAAVL